MDITYKSKFLWRIVLFISISFISRLLFEIFISDDPLNWPIMLFIWSVFLLPALFYAWLEPKQIADEISILTEDKKDFFNNRELMVQMVNLGHHYGFQRFEDYADIRNAAYMKLERKRENVEDHWPAELEIWKSAQGLLHVKIRLKYKFAPFLGPFKELFHFSQELKQQLS